MRFRTAMQGPPLEARRAHKQMIDIEKLSDDELEEIAADYGHIRRECDRERRSRKKQPA